MSCKWGENARYLDGEPMTKWRARYGDIAMVFLIVIGIVDAAYYLRGVV